MTTKTINNNERLQQFLDDEVGYLTQTNEKFGVEPNQNRIEYVLGQETEKIIDILENGLDVGGIVESIEPISELKKTEKHGWVFVSAKTGNYYRVRENI